MSRNGQSKIDVMVITHNEAINLPRCLRALSGWTNRAFVIDSGSDDGTQQLAEQLGAMVVHHDWEGYARQKNWALENLPFEGDWVLIVDADEVITSSVRNRLVEIASRPTDEVPENGFFINRLTYFMGRPIRHCGYFPNWNMRFFKRGLGKYEDREVHEHIVIDAPVGYIHEPMDHEDRRGLEHYIAKHNRYSTLEARALVREIMAEQRVLDAQNIPSETRYRRWLKRNVMPYILYPGFWRFLYMYVARLGFLDGRAGYGLCRVISMYDSMVAMKYHELRRQLRANPNTDLTSPKTVRGLAEAEGSMPERPARPGKDEPEPVQMQPEPSPWTFWEKTGRAIWMLVGKPVFRASFHNWYGFRASILRLFGAKVGRGVTIRPTVNVEVPWLLEIDDQATVGDHAILYSLGKIRIGKRSIISQYSHLCAGTHDYTDHRFRLIRKPITIGDDVWVAADAFIGPGVHIGDLTVVGARASVYKDLPAKVMCVGNPARPIKERVLR